ncbi:MAG TPA: phosphodiester glycosidase family protein [Thermoanaerobaculia bacterium]|nr:phosphodiester glycosidase family protein [Thermoanaerobaculia bacterium]
MTRKLRLVLLFVVALPLAAQWRKVGQGVWYDHRAGDGLDIHIAKVDLSDFAVRVIASNESEHGMTVSEFARKHRATIAINADYFDEALHPVGMAMGTCGVWWKGDPDLKRKQGLVGLGRRRAEIQERTMTPKRWMFGAVSGWPLLVRDCQAINDLPGSDTFTRAPHPRTAVGLSKDRRTMYIVVADGRSESVGGLTLPDLARFMQDLGACSAINLDGGGSSAMWLNNRIVNRPSDGTERKVGNHLAVIETRDFPKCREKKK